MNDFTTNTLLSLKSCNFYRNVDFKFGLYDEQSRIYNFANIC